MTYVGSYSKFSLNIPPFILRQRRQFIRGVSHEKRPRSNEEITATEVLLVYEDGSTARVSSQEALQLARAKEFDLIEISPKAHPPVVKMGNFGQHLYHLQKKERKQRVHSKQREVKMLRMSFRTEKHDLDRIVERTKEFLGERHMVKLVIRLRGRELTNTSYAKEKLTGVVASLADSAEVDQEMKRQGNQFIVVLRPKR